MSVAFRSSQTSLLTQHRLNAICLCWCKINIISGYQFVPSLNERAVKFGGLCYDVLGLSRLNGTDKIINLVFQIRFPVLRDTPQHISYNIYATFDIVSAISREIHTVNASPVSTLVAKDSDGFQIIEKNTSWTTRSFASGSFNESYNVMILPIVMNSMVFHAGAYIPEWFAWWCCIMGFLRKAE